MIIKLKEIALEDKALEKILNYIKKVDYTKYIYSKDDLVYTDGDIYQLDTVLDSKESIDNTVNLVESFIKKYWEQLINKMPISKKDGDMFVVIEPIKKNNEDGPWILMVEQYNGNFYFHLSTNITNIL